MHSVINKAALLYFIWLVVDALGLVSLLVDFLIVGAIPGTNITLSASVMLTIMAICAALLILDIASRHITSTYRIRQSLTRSHDRRASLPQRRFSRT